MPLVGFLLKHLFEAARKAGISSSIALFDHLDAAPEGDVIFDLLGGAGGLGIIPGGVTVDLMRAATGSAFVAYSTLFGFEVIFLLVALYLSTRLDLEASTARQEEMEKLSSVPAD